MHSTGIQDGLFYTFTALIEGHHFYIISTYSDTLWGLITQNLSLTQGVDTRIGLARTRRLGQRAR